MKKIELTGRPSDSVLYHCYLNNINVYSSNCNKFYIFIFKDKKIQLSRFCSYEKVMSTLNKLIHE